MTIGKMILNKFVRVCDVADSLQWHYLDGLRTITETELGTVGFMDEVRSANRKRYHSILNSDYLCGVRLL
jgi:hypothetical protein